jgi:hypothetical protein
VRRTAAFFSLPEASGPRGGTGRRALVGAAGQADSTSWLETCLLTVAESPRASARGAAADGLPSDDREEAGTRLSQEHPVAVKCRVIR